MPGTGPKNLADERPDGVQSLSYGSVSLTTLIKKEVGGVSGPHLRRKTFPPGNGQERKHDQYARHREICPPQPWRSGGSGGSKGWGEAWS
ncbi:hypothetical protein, partial [Methanogenium cariaci]|uniref:hypothetical protein n=1 Tax=Methanogenium cariaci TaxID=2197 RepID=UPI001C45F2C6